ncbi:hypothetical protein [Ferruginibacter albus]|uniref:hypothetical protein n=1 Tax=Ferruginibacter albus TaxID=2875540 RepID=UPI001CC79F3E|nr:hypothetical protein [Ferruginibacter albus]UAY50653.1 hypothetical protein K9M53_08605 [Ferruginibacter albus]
MEIEIIKNTGNGILEINKLKWELQNKERKSKWIFLGICCLALATAGAFIDYRRKELFLNFCLRVAIFLLIALVSLGWIYYKSKRKYFSNINKIIADFNTGNIEAEIKINESKVIYKETSSYIELNWEKFSYYKYYKDCLFLLIGNSYLNSIAIKKSDVSPSDFDELSQFVANKLSQKG